MRASRKRLAAALATLALGAGIVGCGEKEEAEPSKPVAPEREGPATGDGGAGADEEGGAGGAPASEDQIAQTLERVIGGGNPALACEALVTERYVRQAYGDAQGCRAAVSSQRSFAVAVEDVAIRGDAATARARPSGGPNRGETIRSELVLDGGAWRVDSLRSNAPAGP